MAMILNLAIAEKPVEVAINYSKSGELLMVNAAANRPGDAPALRKIISVAAMSEPLFVFATHV